MNGRLGEFNLPHRLPIAVFSYRQDSEKALSAWAPFCDFSPEWVALNLALQMNAEVKFIDLPAWAQGKGFSGHVYSDRVPETEAAFAMLCRRFRMPNFDALWDHLFEGDIPARELGLRLEKFFQELRNGYEPDAETCAREAYMGQWIRASRSCVDGGGRVLVVCGGLHAPALRKAWEDGPLDSWPDLYAISDHASTGSYLVPYSFDRLGRFSGYQSAMPLPAYQQMVWTEGLAQASRWLVQEVSAAVKRKKQNVSSADLVKAGILAQGLAGLRAHGQPLRCDLLDAMTTTFLKEDLSDPMPWNQRGGIQEDPLLRAVLDAATGHREGRLARGTPRPPLVADVESRLDEVGIQPGSTPITVSPDAKSEKGAAVSQLLYRLRSLGIPGYQRTSGPELPRAGFEVWKITRVPAADAALIEAARYGATLHAATVSRLEETLGEAARPDVMADIIMDALFCGLDDFSRRVMQHVLQKLHDHDVLADCAGALARLFSACRQRKAESPSPSLDLTGLFEAIFERTLDLFDACRGIANSDDAPVSAASVMSRAIRHEIYLETAYFARVMERRARDEAAPPQLAGAALGALWSLPDHHETANSMSRNVLDLHGSSHRIGDFLSGLFALARESASSALLDAIDDFVRDYGDEGFWNALPALRMAFEYFPPREKVEIAKHMLIRHGGDPIRAGSWISESINPDEIKKASITEARALARAERYGLMKASDVVPQPTWPSNEEKAVRENAISSPHNPEALRRWRLILGKTAEELCALSSDDMARDNALGWLYERDDAVRDRGGRLGGDGGSSLTVPEWINQVHELFPRKTIERLERDAIELYQIDEVVTNPEVLERVVPNTTLLAAVLRTRHLMNPEVLTMARRLVRQVVDELMKKLRKEMDASFSGARGRTRSHFRSMRNFDIRQTLRENLRYFEPSLGKVIVRHPIFLSSTRQRLPWQIILLVDQSGSMVQSVIHSAVTAACLAGLPGVKIHLLAFDTEVVDMSSLLDDPVEALMRTQLGGGTDIGRALRYAEELITQPRRTLLVVISDFYEGGEESLLVRLAQRLCEQGTLMLGLAALDEDANPDYDRNLASRLVSAGMHVAAMTPGELVGWIAGKIH
jgi:Mg-chelatase subunit ChlD